jgi:hypothetical protein
MIQGEFGNVYASFWCCNDIYYFTYSDLFLEKMVLLLGLWLWVWQKPLEIRFVIYQIQPRNLGKLNAG